MWKNIKMLYQKVPEPFRTLTPANLHSNLYNVFCSKVYFTPKLQKFVYTDELAKYVRYLTRKDKITNTDLRSLTEAILTDYGAINGLDANPKFKNDIDYSITKNYVFKANELSPYFGEVDYMVWLNDTHFVPVMFFENQLNAVAGLGMAHAAMGLKSLARNHLKTSGYSIVTTGQQWQMFKVYNTMKAQKTVVYQGKNRFRNILEDMQMIETIMGLIDESLQTQRQQVQILKLAYDILDDQKYMIQAKTKEQAERMSPLSKLLLKYFKKKEDQTSK